MNSIKPRTAAATCVAMLILAAACPAQTRPPNVIIIMADDQGSIDAGCYGANDIQTPAIDALAREGVRFTQFYAGAPVCSPSRAALLTGRYPWKTGVAVNAPDPPSEAIDELAPTDEGQALDGDVITIAELLHNAGYVTAHVGKWHLGWSQQSRPLAQGFDYSFGHLGGCIDNYSHGYYWSGPNRHDLWENQRRVRMPGRYFPDLMIEKATAFMNQNKDRPFLLYFAINMPHYPYQGDVKWLERYRDLPYPRRLYAAFLSTMDDHIGQLLHVVEQLGLRKQTIIIYQSDNGHSTEVRAHGGGGDNGPYRGAKFSVFEGGIRLPAIIAWPGHLPQGQVRSQVVHSCDWYPTIAKLCNVPLPDRQLDGKCIEDVIRSPDAPTPHETLEWQYRDEWAVRCGPWKLMHNVKDPAKDGPPLTKADHEWFLANIESDPGETTNQAADHPDLVKKLTTQHDASVAK